MTIDDIAQDLVAPVKALNTRLAQLKAEIADKQRELAALQTECAVARKAMNELGDQRVELQAAVNGAKAELVRVQNAQASAQGAYDETKRKILKLVG
jgi:chromosome segregation ATPase